ncbi:MAG: HAMP domain-containing histidine kinase, partial [Lachnospiraceae bacterium]|nr:HAMP domain-containing histidine kinase [Lachnospiraceae bacterium]
SDETAYQMFSMEGYYAAVYRIAKKDSVMELILLYSLAEMEAGIQNQRILVLFAALIAVIVLGLFSWCFTGKMLRPIQENQQKQTEFIAAASHELRTPLAAILSATSAMERAEPMQRSQFFDMIHREGNRMSRLIGDMLTLASADSKAWQLQKESIELDMLLLEVYEAHYPLAKEKGLNLTLSLYEQDIPPIQLDRDRITQVLSILLDNARNLTPAPGKIELELTVQRNRVQVRVSDSGPGVPDSEKRRIFERFYRSEKSRSDRGHFGLGLSIASEIVKKHNGRIWVQDATIGGAEFVVELPLV